MLDTIHASTNVNISWFDELKGWKDRKNRRGTPYKEKNIYLKNGASIYMSYYPISRYLSIQFSASRVQHGGNAIAYDYSKSYLVEEAIAKVLTDELYIGYDTTDFYIYRLDLNKDFVFHDDKVAKLVEDFANKILPSRCETRRDYETGYTSQSKKGKGLRVYRKDKDDNLTEEEKAELPPTVRFEFQINKSKVKKIFKCKLNLHQILTIPYTSVLAWNCLLSEYALDKMILNQHKLYKEASKYLTKSDFVVLKQMNENPSFDDKDLRRKQLEVIRKLKKVGICPYSCEMQLHFTKSICHLIKTVHRKKNETCNRLHGKRRPYALIDTNETVARWYLDSS